jgi:predicted aconitase
MYLSAEERDMLAGAEGDGASFAMQLLLAVAEAWRAPRLVEISSAHVAGAYDNGRANHDFAERLARGGARVRVPTTLTACSADLRSGAADPGTRALVDLYRGMGCDAALTCAPYDTGREPQHGEDIAWCESSAVIYANSVLGARTNRYVEFLDLCAAVTGRVPEAGLHVPGNRRPAVLVRLQALPAEWLATDWFFEVFGIWLGRRLGDRIPAIDGLPPTTSRAQLRKLAAAFGTTGSANLFHATGLTPEAGSMQYLDDPGVDTILDVSAVDLQQTASGLSRNRGEDLAAVCLGAPHFSPQEFTQLVKLVDGRKVNADIRFVVATSRAVLGGLDEDGSAAILERAGVEIVTDRCTYYRPVVDGCRGHVMTSSAKWAYYAPSSLGVPVTFSDLESCVDSACAGRVVDRPAPWGPG